MTANNFDDDDTQSFVPLTAGTKVSHYEIISKIGAGGMGEVYLAEDSQLDRKVALKFLPSHLSQNEASRARFTREAKAAAKLDHPNIVPVYEVGEFQGRPFFAMAHIEGQTLREVIKQGKLSVADAVDLTMQICEGLNEAHSAGVVHRDIKPANIIIDKKGKPRLLDFGLATVAGQEKLTKTGSTFGTASYMSPEQVQGQKVDHRSDIFSVGVVLYEMIAGRLPFKGEHDAAVAYSIVHEDPEEVASLRPGVPEAIAEIAHRALAKKPADRFATAQELLDTLKATREADSISPSLISIIRRPSFMVTGITLLIALTAIAFWWRDYNAKIEWALYQAIPQIEILVKERNYYAAFALAERVEVVVPDSPRLSKLWPTVSRIISMNSDPEGADIYRREYSAVDEKWEYLGRTPIDSLRFPQGFSRLRIVKEGFETVEVANLSYRLNKRSYTLDTVGSIPTGMIRARGGKRSLSLPGLDHIKAEETKDVFLDKFEVTNSDFKKFVDGGGYRNRIFWKHPFVRDSALISWEEAMDNFKDKTGRFGPATWEVGDYPTGEENFPVMGVSWYEAAAYAEFAGKNLPTIFHWSAAAGPQLSYAIVPLSNFGDGPTDVESHKGMNPSGAYGMSGNVREWCQNESNESGQRFIMGGGWKDPAYSFNDAYTQHTFDRSPTNGFRCIKYIDKEENLASLTRTIKLPYRDFLSQKPVSDETFKIFLGMYAYDKTELNAKQENFDDSGDDAIEEVITFDAAYGNERVTAYLFLPKNSDPPYQTVIIFPGSDAIHAKDASPIQRYRNRHFDFILKSGRAVMFPIYKGTLTRGDELDSDYPDETNFYKEHVVMWVKDFSRSIDYLETRQDINSQKLAYYGLSWGAALGAIVPAVETRIKVSVLFVAGISFQNSLPEVEPVNYLPRMKTPVLMLNGKYDQYFPVETSQKPMFQLFGTHPEHKRYVLYEAGHFVPRDQLVKETLDWLDKYLGEVKM